MTIRAVTTALAIALGIGVPVASAATPQFGFNEDFTLVPSFEVAVARSLGATVARFEIVWPQVERVRGQYDFSTLGRHYFAGNTYTQTNTYDATYAALRASGVQVVLVLMGSPCRTHPAGCTANFTTPPDSRHAGDLRRFVEAVVRHFPDAEGVEIGNEQNGSFWTPHPDPRVYARYFNIAYGAVKRISPHMPVVFGGLAATDNRFAAYDAIPDAQFLRQARDAGLRRPDAIADHPYTFIAQANPHQYGIMERNIARGVASVYPGVPLWITEAGVSTALTGSDANEAAATAAIYEALKHLPNVKMIMFHHLIEWGNNLDGYGFVDTNGTLKPVAQTMLGLVA